MIRVGIIGNCCTKGMSRSVEHIIPNADITTIYVGDILGADEIQQSRWLEALSRCEIVLTLPLYGTRWGKFDTSELSRLFSSVVVYPYFSFTGFHPDCGYVFVNDEVVDVPGYSYCSAIVAGAYLAQLPRERVFQLFNSFAYSSLGYFEEILHAKTEFLRISAGLGFDLDLIFDSPGSFMHTINHPCISLIYLVTSQALKRFGFSKKDRGDIFDDLSQGPVWPIYPEIGNKLNIESGALVFKKNNVFVDLNLFINDSFSYFDSIGGVFQSPAIIRVKDFVVSEVKF